jgi:hypothetical protein
MWTIDWTGKFGRHGARKIQPTPVANPGSLAFFWALMLNTVSGKEFAVSDRSSVNHQLGLQFDPIPIR